MFKVPQLFQQQCCSPPFLHTSCSTAIFYFFISETLFLFYFYKNVVWLFSKWLKNHWFSVRTRRRSRRRCRCPARRTSRPCPGLRRPRPLCRPRVPWRAPQVRLHLRRQGRCDLHQLWCPGAEGRLCHRRQLQVSRQRRPITVAHRAFFGVLVKHFLVSTRLYFDHITPFSSTVLYCIYLGRFELLIDQTFLCFQRSYHLSVYFSRTYHNFMRSSWFYHKSKCCSWF